MNFFIVYCFSYIHLYQHVIRLFHTKTSRKILKRLNTLPQGTALENSKVRKLKIIPYICTTIVLRQTTTI